MYNALVLVALLPLSGPDVGQHVAAMPPAPVIRYVRKEVALQDDAGERIPVLPADKKPIRALVAYASEETAPSATRAPLPVRRETDPVAPPSGFAPLNLSSTPTPASNPASAPSPTLPVASTPTESRPYQPPGAATPTVNTAKLRDPNQVETSGLLEIPKRNQVVLAASVQAVLMELRTEQQDAEGKTVTVPITEGMKVQKGQILGTLDDRELKSQLLSAKSELNVAIAEKEKTIEVEYAGWGKETAKAEVRMLKETNSLHARTVPQIEILKAELNLKQAEANLDLSKYNIEIVATEKVKSREADINVVEVRIELRKLISPIDGVIVKIEKAEGEWLREGDPILEIVQLETLRAKCKIDARFYTPDMVDGKEATVFMPMVNGRTEEFPGRVVFVDEKVVAGDVFEVVIEVQNAPSGRSWKLLPGSVAAATIHL